MFSIIDNKINVNFQILGGSAVTVTPTSTGVTPPTRGTSGARSSFVSSSATGKPTDEQYQYLFDTVSSYVVSHIKNLWTDNKQWDDFRTEKPLFNQITKQEFDEKFEEYQKNQTGGRILDDALSKDIQLDQKGGTKSYFKDALIQYILDSEDDTVSETRKRIFEYDNTIKDQALSNYKPLDFIGESVSFENVTRRNNNMLEVKIDDGDYININDYFQKLQNVKGRLEQKTVMNDCFVNKENAMYDDDACKKSIKELAKTIKTREDVQKINPYIAFKMLVSLGIGGHQTTRGIKVQPYDEWYNNLEEKKKNIYNTLDASELVKLVIAYVNSNPAILNKKDISNAAGPDNSNVFPAAFNPKEDDFEAERNLVSEKIKLIRARLYGVTGDNIFLSLTGGGYIFPSKSNNKMENIPKFSKQIRSAFAVLKSRLNSYQKTLGEKTQRKIEEIFSNLEKHELEAETFISKIDAYYIDLKANNDRSNTYITDAMLDEAKKNLDKNLKKIHDRSYQLFDINSVITKAVVDAAKKQSNVINLPSSI